MIDEPMEDRLILSETDEFTPYNYCDGVSSFKHKSQLSLDSQRNKLHIKFHNNLSPYDVAFNNDKLYVRLQTSGYNMLLNKTDLSEHHNPYEIQLGTINNLSNEYVLNIDIKTMHMDYRDYDKMKPIVEISDNNYLMLNCDSFIIEIFGRDADIDKDVKFVTFHV